MNAPRMRRRYRTSSPRRGLLYLLLFLALAAFYVGQQVYAQRLGVVLGDMEQKVRTMESRLGTLRAERDRLTSPAFLGVRAGALGLRAADITQLARVPLTLPPPVPEKDDPDQGLGGVFARVWQWLDGPTVQKQEVLAAP
jgi:hypothetical protein